MEKDTTSLLNYNDIDFQTDKKYMREYFERVLNTKINYYKIDVVKTKVDVYGQAKANDKVLLKPIELLCKMNIPDVDKKFMSEGNIYSETVSCVFSILKDDLEKNNITINIGDYIGYLIDGTEIMFEVNSLSNLTSIDLLSKGFKSFFKNYGGILAKEDVVKKLRNVQ